MITQNTRHLSNNFWWVLLLWSFLVGCISLNFTTFTCFQFHCELLWEAWWLSKQKPLNQLNTQKLPSVLQVSWKFCLAPHWCVFTQSFTFLRCFAFVSPQFPDCHQRPVWPAEKLCKRSISPKTTFKTSRNSSQNQHDNADSLRKL